VIVAGVVALVVAATTQWSDRVPTHTARAARGPTASFGGVAGRAPTARTTHPRARSPWRTG
jgi:hypothetical protein